MGRCGLREELESSLLLFGAFAANWFIYLFHLLPKLPSLVGCNSGFLNNITHQVNLESLTVADSIFLITLDPTVYRCLLGLPCMKQPSTSRGSAEAEREFLPIDSAPARLLDKRETVALELFTDSKVKAQVRDSLRKLKPNEWLAGQSASIACTWCGGTLRHVRLAHLVSSRVKLLIFGGGKSFTGSTWRTWRFQKAVVLSIRESKSLKEGKIPTWMFQEVRINDS